MKKLEHYISTIKNSSVIIGSLQGRFYGMDRDENWDRTEKCFALLTGKYYTKAPTWQSTLKNAYAQKIYDEFIPPTSLHKDCFIENGHSVIFFNTRPERMRQLVALFLTKGPALASLITATSYHREFPVEALYQRPALETTLLDTLVQKGLTLFTIAESEKFAHVTYYINGERTIERPQEERVRIPSLRLASYIDAPAMSAAQITTAVIASLNQEPRDFYLINYANADMVGHSGNMDATIAAIEVIDHELNRLYQAFIHKHQGTMFVTADHGNAEKMWDDEYHQAHTAHTTNPVPFFMISPHIQKTRSLPLHTLADIAPFILSYMCQESF